MRRPSLGIGVASTFSGTEGAVTDVAAAGATVSALASFTSGGQVSRRRLPNPASAGMFSRSVVASGAQAYSTTKSLLQRGAGSRNRLTSTTYSHSALPLQTLRSSEVALPGFTPQLAPYVPVRI